MLHDIAEGRAIEHARVLALADAVLSTEVVSAAMNALAAEPKFILRRAIELAALIVQEYDVRMVDATTTSAATGEADDRTNP